MSKTATTITEADALDYARNGWNQDHYRVRATGETGTVPSGKYEGREGALIQIRYLSGEDYRGIEPGTWVDIIVYRRDDGKRTSCFTAEWAARAQAGIDAHRARRAAEEAR